MVNINLLDKILNYVRAEEIYSLTEEDNPDFTKEENVYLLQALKRLENDGYIFAEHENQYLVTFDGLLALQKTFFFLFRNRPYRRCKLKASVMDFWLLIKVVAVVLNSLLLLALAVLTFLIKD